MRSRPGALPRPLLALYAGTIATRLGTFVVPYLTLYLSQTRGFDFSTTGRVIAAGGVGLLLGNVAGGWLADDIGRKATLLCALAVNILGVAALAFVLPSSMAYALALAIALAGAGMYTPAANAWIADLTAPAQRQRAYTINYICINVGMGIGPLLGGLLASASFRWLFVGDLATTVVCAAFIAGASAGPQPRPPTGRWLRIRDELAPWRSPTALRVLAFCGASFFVIAPLMGMEYVVPLIVGTVLEQPLVLVGAVYTINATCILALGLPIDRLVRGADPRLMMALAGGLWALGLLLLARDLSAGALLGSTVVWTLGEIIASVVLPTYVSRHVEASVRGRILALPDVLRSLAGIVAPVGLGLVWEHAGVGVVLNVLVVTPAIGAVLYASAWWMLRRSVRRAT